jgi:hypothetical protein
MTLTYIEINFARSDDLSPFARLFSFEFYREILDGMRTDTVANLVVWISPSVTWIALCHSGN